MFRILVGKPMTGKTEFMLATLEGSEYDFVIIIHLVQNIQAVGHEYEGYCNLITDKLPKRTDFSSNLTYCVVFEDFYTRDIKHYRMQEITDFIYFLKTEVHADIFLITQNKYDVPEPILELSNNVITFEPKEQKEYANEPSSDTESEEQKESVNKAESVPYIVNKFLFNSVDRIAKYISNSKYISRRNEKK